MLEMVIDALAKSGRRGIINVMGKFHNIPGDVLAIDSSDCAQVILACLKI